MQLLILIDNAISRTNNDLYILRQRQSADTAFKAKAKWYEYSEKSNKYFLNLNKKFKKQKLIIKMVCDGVTFKGHANVVTGISAFYIWPSFTWRFSVWTMVGKMNDGCLPIFVPLSANVVHIMKVPVIYVNDLSQHEGQKLSFTSPNSSFPSFSTLPPEASFFFVTLGLVR